MHESIFTYSITRPYPFKWFTWVVIIGGIVATSLVSVFSVAATGYEISLLYAIDPNATEFPSNPAWFQRKPWSLASKVSPKCQSQSISLGSQFYTNNFGFSYRLLSLFNHEGDAQSSFTYFNDVLHDCVVTGMTLNGRNATQDVSSFDASATINCTLYENEKPLTLVLATTAVVGRRGINAGPVGTDGMSTFLSIGEYKQPALFWGQLLLAYDATHLHVFCARRNLSMPSGQWIFKRQDSYRMQQPDFVFQLEDRNQTQVLSVTTFGANSLIRSGVGTSKPLSTRVWGLTFGQDILEQNLSTTVDYSSILSGTNKNVTEIRDISDVHVAVALIFDDVGKGLYSTIMTDLGQLDQSNYIADPRQVMTYVNRSVALQLAVNNTNITTFYEWWTQASTTVPEPEEPKDWFKWLGVGYPQVNQSRITTRYLCQVPKLKAGGSLFFSVLVADAVFLQILWILLNFFATFHLERQQPQAKHCVGCSGAHSLSEGLELKDRSYATSTITSYEPLLKSTNNGTPADSWGESVVERYPNQDMAKGPETTVQLLS